MQIALDKLLDCQGLRECKTIEEQDVALFERTVAIFADSLVQWTNFAGSLEQHSLIQVRTIKYQGEPKATQYRSKCAVNATSLDLFEWKTKTRRQSLATGFHNAPRLLRVGKGSSKQINSAAEAVLSRDSAQTLFTVQSLTGEKWKTVSKCKYRELPLPVRCRRQCVCARRGA